MNTAWLRKERRKLHNASEKESLEEKEELHEEICDDVRVHSEKVAEENEQHFRMCVQALDKQVAFREAKAALERKKADPAIEESSSETSEEELVEEPIMQE